MRRVLPEAFRPRLRATVGPDPWTHAMLICALPLSTAVVCCAPIGSYAPKFKALAAIVQLAPTLVVALTVAPVYVPACNRQLKKKEASPRASLCFVPIPGIAPAPEIEPRRVIRS